MREPDDSFGKGFFDKRDDKGNNAPNDSLAGDFSLEDLFGFNNKYSKQKPEKKKRIKKRHTTSAETSKRIGCGLNKKDKPIEDMTSSEKKQTVVEKPGLVFLLFGVIIPFTALIAEYSSHYLAANFFDPFPTVYHFLLFLLIPTSNFLAWLSARANIATLYCLASLASGMSLGICILYSLMVLPLLSVFLTNLPAGIFGLAPLVAIPFCLHTGNLICALSARQDSFFDAHQSKHLGHVIILLMVVAVELPSTLTRIYLSDATDSSKSLQAVSWLRSWGSREVLLRACYERSGRATDIVGSLYEHQHPVSIDQARRIYYLVTGVPFNSTPIPPSFRGTIAHAGLIHDPEQLNANADDEFDLDADIAGEKISGVARGLQTSESLISGFVEPGACLASLDWTFSFTNISKVPREARAKIILPDGAVVTRATMWIDAIEKEATIMPRGLARATYETAVKTHKRDPLLVSMAGKDTILVQCYPVLAGSDTKLKLHIIAPMMSAGENGMSLTLPMFDERNFGFSEAHKISLASSTPITISGTDLKSARNDSGFLLSGNLDNKTISRYEAIIHSERGNNNIAFVDGKSGQSLSLKTDLQRLQLLRPKALIIIVDKSKTVEPYLEQICRGLANLPADMEVSIVSILDQTKLLYKKGDPEKNNLTKALAELKESGCRGGQINAPTIARLLNDFTGSGADLLWIHASQPVAEQVDTSTINYILKSRPDSPRLWNLQVASGPNSAITDDNYSEKLLRVPRTGSLADDISGLFSLWNTKTAEKASKPVLIENEKTSLALSRLARYQQILDLYNNGDRYGSYALAEKYHLITPVSSAVVSDDALVASYEAKFEENGQGLSQAAARRLQTIFGNKIAGVNSAGLNTGRKLSLDSMPELVGKVTDRLDSLSSSAGSAGSIDGYSADYQPTYRPERQALPESKSLDNSIQSKVKSKEGRLEIKTKLGSDHLNFTDSDYQTYADAFNSKSYNQAMPAKQEGAKMSLGGGGGESFQSRREKEREPGMAGGDAADDRSASPPPLLSKDELSTPSSAPVEAFGKGAQEQQIYLNENNIALLDKKSPEPENRQRQFYGKQSNPAPQAATNGTIGTQGQDAMNFDQTPFGATADIADAQPRSGTPSLLKIVFFLLALPASMVVAFLLLRKLIRPEKD